MALIIITIINNNNSNSLILLFSNINNDNNNSNKEPKFASTEINRISIKHLWYLELVLWNGSYLLWSPVKEI